MLTTLNNIRSHFPCTSGWVTLLRYLGKHEADDEPLSLATILDSNGVRDARWCLRTVNGWDRERRLFSVWCARGVQHLMPDHRSIEAMFIAERFANGEATERELEEARGRAFAVAGCVLTSSSAPMWAAKAAYSTTEARVNLATEAPSWAAHAAAVNGDADPFDTRYEAICDLQEFELRRVVACIEAGVDPYPKGMK